MDENENDNENDALTMISKPLGRENTLMKEDSSSVDDEVQGENSSSEEIGIHLSRNLLGSKFKVPKTV